MTVLAQTSRPDAAVAIVGILFVTVVPDAAIGQIFTTAKARMTMAREELARASAELTGELERMLKEVG